MIRCKVFFSRLRTNRESRGMRGIMWGKLTCEMREKLTLLHFLEYSVARRELWRFKRIEWINCLLTTHKIIFSCTSSNCWNLFQKTALILTLLWRITLSQGESREDEGKEGEVAESHCSTISPLSPPPSPILPHPFLPFLFRVDEIWGNVEKL